jgi:hypothetical protein
VGANAIWVRKASNPEAWQKLELPTALAALPLVWGSALLIPGADGRVYLIDPVTGQSAAEPFVPVYERDRRGRWRSPVRLDPTTVVLADDAGRVRRLVLEQSPVPRLTVQAAPVLDRTIISDPAATTAAVIVATSDQKVRALAARDLSPVGAWALESPLVDRPLTVGERCFAYDAAGGVLALGRDGERLWSIKLDEVAVGKPVIANDLIWFLDRSGRLHGRALADGAAREKIDLGVLPAGGLMTLGTQMVVPVGLGTVQAIALNATHSRQP